MHFIEETTIPIHFMRKCSNFIRFLRNLSNFLLQEQSPSLKINEAQSSAPTKGARLQQKHK